MTSEYETYLRDKVDAARHSKRAGKGLSHAEVEAHFAKRRARINGQT